MPPKTADSSALLVGTNLDTGVPRRARELSARTPNYSPKLDAKLRACRGDPPPDSARAVRVKQAMAS